MVILTKNYKELTEFIQERTIIVAHHNGFTNAMLSAILGKSESSYKKYHYNESAMPLEQFFGVLFESGAVEILSLMAKRMHCVVVPLPKSSSTTADYLKKSAKVLKETGDVVGAIGKSLADGKYTLREKRHTLEQVDDAISALAALRERLSVDIKAGEDE